MAVRKKITRRVFLIGLFSSGFIFLAKFLLDKLTVFKSSPTEKFEKGLIQLFSNDESAKAVGLAYLKGAPGEKDRRRLISAISSLLESKPIPTETEPQRLLEKLRICRQRDFKEGRVTEVQGWLLPITEARLCALVALQPTLLEQILGYLK